MMLYGYCYYNRKIGAYTAPSFNQYPKDIASESVQRAFLMSHGDEKAFYEEHDFYYLGSFDDKTAHFDLITPEFICNFKEMKDDKEN